MRVMLISLVKAVSEMCSTVFIRVLFVQINYRLHFQVTTMSGAAVMNEIENSCHYVELSRIFWIIENLFLFPTSLNLYCHISRYRVSLLVSSWPQKKRTIIFPWVSQCNLFSSHKIILVLEKRSRKMLIPIITNHQTNWIVMFNV